MSTLQRIPESPGLFIVFEGVDRVGKSTQARLLAEHLGVEKAEPIRFPNYDAPGGGLLRGYLLGLEELTLESAHLMFSANRWSTKSSLVKTLERGKTVICDRYAYSGVAYSTAKGLPFEWCKTADTGLPVPDVVFYLSMPIDDSAARSGFGANDRHETVELQHKIKSVFEEQLMGTDTEWVMIDASKPLTEIAAQIRGCVDSMLANESKRRVLNHSGLFKLGEAQRSFQEYLVAEAARLIFKSDTDSKLDELLGTLDINAEKTTA